MNIEKLLQEFNVDHITGGNKHCTEGWVNVHCPFCSGSQNYHLGIQAQTGVCNCWRCGWKPTHKTLARILHVSDQEAKQILRKYRGIKSPKKQQKVTIRRKSHKLPYGTSGLTDRHRQYLQNRRFNSSWLERHFYLLGTGPVSYLDHIDYRHRILIPIIWEDQQVSFQCRDITGKSDIKYKACPKGREIIAHKEVLYCHPNIDWSKPVVLVEGVTDVWRLGKQAAATFGIEFTDKQVMQVIRKKKQTQDRQVYIMYDSDPQARVQAGKLQDTLAESEINCSIGAIKSDPADLDQETANETMEELCQG